MQVEDVCNGGVVGCVVLHFKPRALVWWSAENSKVSMIQLKIRESADIHQLQGLFILANCGQPKWTVGALVILKVFNGIILRPGVNIHLVIYSLTRIFDVYAKVRDVVLVPIFISLNYVEALDWTSKGRQPSRRNVFLSAAHELCRHGL
jgi:hypothetical protein